ncbi:MAG: PilZ domain-containing protein [Bradyrhizobium sp.]|nr:PilZ domain-containing protein [Bradyrhizobium sp.]
MSEGEQRAGPRVRFEQDVPAQMMAIDGTWRRDCVIEDVSDGGAKLTVGDSIKGLHISEFFLVLSSRGLAYRRCQLVWVNGDRIGVSFIKRSRAMKRQADAATRS